MRMCCQGMLLHLSVHTRRRITRPGGSWAHRATELLAGCIADTTAKPPLPAGGPHAPIQVVSEAADACACTMLAACPSQRLLPKLLSTLVTDKNGRLRQAAAEWLLVALEGWDPAEWERQADSVERSVLAAAADAQAETRATARALFAAYACAAPAAATAALARLRDRDRALQERLAAAVAAAGERQLGGRLAAGPEPAHAIVLPLGVHASVGRAEPAVLCGQLPRCKPAWHRSARTFSCTPEGWSFVVPPAGMLAEGSSRRSSLGNSGAATPRGLSRSSSLQAAGPACAQQQGGSLAAVRMAPAVPKLALGILSSNAAGGTRGSPPQPSSARSASSSSLAQAPAWQPSTARENQPENRGAGAAVHATPRSMFPKIFARREAAASAEGEAEAGGEGSRLPPPAAGRERPGLRRSLGGAALRMSVAAFRVRGGGSPLVSVGVWNARLEGVGPARPQFMLCMPLLFPAYPTIASCSSLDERPILSSSITAPCSALQSSEAEDDLGPGAARTAAVHRSALRAPLPPMQLSQAAGEGVPQQEVQEQAGGPAGRPLAARRLGAVERQASGIPEDSGEGACGGVCE